MKALVYLVTAFLHVLAFGLNLYVAGMRENAGDVHWPSVGLSGLLLVVAMLAAVVGVRALIDDARQREAR